MTPLRRQQPSRVRDIPTDPSGTRKLAFAAFVRRALETARTTRAWNGSEVARRTGISRQTINRWVRGDWASDPEPERVVAFCTGLGLDSSPAFALLGWDRSVRPAPVLDPDLAALARRLADPAISEQEKFHIRETVRYLAHRPALPTEEAAARTEREGAAASPSVPATTGHDPRPANRVLSAMPGVSPRIGRRVRGGR